jgi:hypothetical protein
MVVVLTHEVDNCDMMLVFFASLCLLILLPTRSVAGLVRGGGSHGRGSAQT